jgi:alkyldihydroxyacetonephosphate synthase
MRERGGDQPADVLVVRPATYEQVSRLLVLAAAEGLKLVPVGAATGVCGAVAVGEGQVALDLRGLDRILGVDEIDLTCRVQAGVIGMDLEDHLTARGLTLGHYPSSLPVSTVGGLVATRSSGQQSTYYGNVEHLVLGLTVALADGTILTPLPGPRSAVGPGLQQFLVGSEGGLGVILEVVFRVARLPEAVIGRGYLFDELGAGLEAMRTLLQRGIRPLVLRLYDQDDTRFQGGDTDGCLMIVAVAGAGGVAAAQAEVVEACARAAKPLGEASWSRWIEKRFDLSADRLREFLATPASLLDTIEVACRWSALERLHGDIKSALAPAGIALCHFSHGEPQGCCAYFTFGGIAASEEAARATYSQAWEGAMEACRRHGASVSHHHGVGQVRAGWARQELGGWWRAWEALRDGLDPAALLNPRALGGR